MEDSRGIPKQRVPGSQPKDTISSSSSSSGSSGSSSSSSSSSGSSGSSSSDSGHGMSMAEKLAMDSAKEAGWRMRWPHIRMMSQSPDLTTTTTPAAAAAAASSLSNPSPGLAPQPKHSAAKSTVGAWTQVLGFIAELAEVFETKHEERAGTAAAAATEEEEDDEEGEGVDAQDSMSEVSPQAHHAASSSPPGRTVQFMRAHPLLCLLLGWALLATTDWLVTSKAVPHLLTLLTQSAWHSPPPPSTALPFDAPRGSAWGGSSQAHFTRWLALRWESLRLGVDDMGWRVQCAVVYGLSGFVCGHALQWAVVACGSLVVLRRCLRVGVRPTVAYVTYFGVAHLALSRVVLPPAGGGEATGGCDALDLVATCAGAAPYWCAEDVCRVAAVASVAGGGSGRTGLPAQSPFADAVAAAAAQGRSLEDRRQQRTRRLHAWRQAATKGSPATDGIRVNLILALATAAAFVCAAQRVRIPGVSFVRAFALFLLLDYACRRTLATLWPSAGDRYLRGGRMAKWLAFHVLGVFVLMVAREAAMRVLAMRVWYRTVVHERRRDGVAVLGRRRRNVAGVRLVRNYAGASANQARSTQTQSNQAASAVAAAYAHRVCFLCLSGFCEKCLLSMEIWPTTAAAVPTADLHSLAEASGSGPGSGPGSRRGRSRSKQNAQHVDPLLVEPANGLPSLRSSLLTIGLLGPSAVAAAAAPLPSMSSSSSKRASKMVDFWMTCSVAHCPCRPTHGLGPSSFVPKPKPAPAAAGATARPRQPQPQPQPFFVQQQQGTVHLSLSQYFDELRALGLVRAVDASICSVSGCDPSAAVLPLIFGRFTVPEYPQSLAAAAQLMVPSSGSSLATATADNVLEAVTEQLWRRAAFLAPDQPRARILNVDTPLAVARSEVDLERSFALSLTSMGVAGGCEAQVSVLLTPCLAHLLLAHEVTAHTAVVSVPPVLAPCTASSSSLRPPQQQNQQQNQQPGADAYYDFVRVQVPRHDIVLRVNGQRWPQHQISALHAPIIIRGLVPGNSYTVCLTILGMRSAELYIRPRDLFGGNNSGNTGDLTAAAAAAGVLLGGRKNVEGVRAELRDLGKRLSAADLDIRRMNRDIEGISPADTAVAGSAGGTGELGAARTRLERQRAESHKLDARHRQLTHTLDQLNSEVSALCNELEQLTSSSTPALSSSLSPPPSSSLEDMSVAYQEEQTFLVKKLREDRDGRAKDLRKLTERRSQLIRAVEEKSRRAGEAERRAGEIRRMVEEVQKGIEGARAAGIQVGRKVRETSLLMPPPVMVDLDLLRRQMAEIRGMIVRERELINKY